MDSGGGRRGTAEPANWSMSSSLPRADSPDGAALPVTRNSHDLKIMRCECQQQRFCRKVSKRRNFAGKLTVNPTCVAFVWGIFPTERNQFYWNWSGLVVYSGVWPWVLTGFDSYQCGTQGGKIAQTNATYDCLRWKWDETAPFWNITTVLTVHAFRKQN